MPTPNRIALYVTGAALTLAATVFLHTPKVAAAIRAALVEVTVPTTPFFASTRGTGINLRPTTFGPDTGTLGISNITVTNITGETQLVRVFAAAVNNPGLPGCTNGAGLIPGAPDLSIEVPPGDTRSLSFPAPLVIQPDDGHTCLGVFGGDPSLEITVTGFID